ncbi:MAG: hypothetical protein M1839_008909 [Geoglossum umbratile]|nr:MAG: hypothetical protein M1839_008909 [Geoglossum umbratile]
MSASPSISEAPNEVPVPYSTGLTYPPFTSKSRRPPTLGRESLTLNLNSITATTTSLPASNSLTGSSEEVTSPQLSTIGTSGTATTPQTQATLMPVSGTWASTSKTPFWLLTVGAGGLVLIAFIMWYARRQHRRKHKETIKNDTRLQALQRPGSRGSAHDDLRSDATLHRDVSHSAQPPIPIQSNFQKSDRRRLDILADRDHAKVRWIGLSATTSDANPANLANLSPAMSNESTTGRSEFFNSSIRSDESEFDVIRREEPINEAYKQFRLESRDQKLREGHRIQSAMSVNDSIFEGDQALILVPGDLLPLPTIRLPTATPQPPSPGLYRPPPAAQLRPEYSPRRLQEIQPHEIRQPTPLPAARDGPTLLTPQAHYRPKHKGPQSKAASLIEGDTTTGTMTPTASENLSQADFGVWTEASYTDTEISDDVWRDEVLRNRRLGR